MTLLNYLMLLVKLGKGNYQSRLGALSEGNPRCPRRSTAQAPMTESVQLVKGPASLKELTN